MKKLAILFVSLMILGACSKDKNNNNNNTSGPSGLTARLIGTWDMTELTYAAQIPNPLNPLSPIDVAGDAQDVDGTFVVAYSPNSVIYNYSFTIADAQLPFPVPVNQAGEATWEVLGSDTKVYMEEDGETIIYDVVTNEATRQVWSGTLPFTIPGAGITVSADIIFTLEKR